MVRRRWRTVRADGHVIQVQVGWVLPESELQLGLGPGGREGECVLPVAEGRDRIVEHRPRDVDPVDHCPERTVRAAVVLEPVVQDVGSAGRSRKRLRQEALTADRPQERGVRSAMDGTGANARGTQVAGLRPAVEIPRLEPAVYEEVVGDDEMANERRGQRIPVWVRDVRPHSQGIGADGRLGVEGDVELSVRAVHRGDAGDVDRVAARVHQRELVEGEGVRVHGGVEDEPPVIYRLAIERARQGGGHDRWRPQAELGGIRLAQRVAKRDADVRADRH